MSSRVHHRPLVVALGGGLREGSSTERALAQALRYAEATGARTLLISGSALDLPLYAPPKGERPAAVRSMVEALAEADGVIIGSPGYHGGVSGVVKNAIDYIEDLSGGSRSYLEGRAVGCIATGAGWQGAISTLQSLRVIVHALRGWNTPMGVAINTADGEAHGGVSGFSERTHAGLDIMAGQVVEFAMREAAVRAARRLTTATPFIPVTR